MDGIQESTGRVVGSITDKAASKPKVVSWFI